MMSEIFSSCCFVSSNVCFCFFFFKDTFGFWKFEETVFNIVPNFSKVFDFYYEIFLTRVEQ